MFVSVKLNKLKTKTTTWFFGGQFKIQFKTLEDFLGTCRRPVFTEIVGILCILI